MNKRLSSKSINVDLGGGADHIHVQVCTNCIPGMSSPDPSDKSVVMVMDFHLSKITASCSEVANHHKFVQGPNCNMVLIRNSWHITVVVHILSELHLYNMSRGSYCFIASSLYPTKLR